NVTGLYLSNYLIRVSFILNFKLVLKIKHALGIPICVYGQLIPYCSLCGYIYLLFKIYVVLRTCQGTYKLLVTFYFFIRSSYIYRAIDPEIKCRWSKNGFAFKWKRYCNIGKFFKKLGKIILGLPLESFSDYLFE